MGKDYTLWALGAPAYTVAQAAALADVAPSTVRRWINGTQQGLASVFGGGKLEPEPGGAMMLSFLQLAEVVVVARFRRAGRGQRPIRLARIRAAHEYARKEMGVPFPFAACDLLRFGGNILHGFDVAHPAKDGLVALDQSGQWTLPGVVEHELTQFDYEPDIYNGVVSRWFPLGRDGIIVVDPQVASGQPVVRDTGVRVETLYLRNQAGESISYLSRDYSIPEDRITEAIAFAAA